MPTTLLLALAGMAVAVLYALACWQAPFGPCRRCRLGRHADPLCRFCDGTGRRVRLGRRAWTYLTRLHDRA